MQDIQTLTSQVEQLGKAHSFWSDLSVWLIALSVFATAVYFVSQWMSNRRANELNGAQASLMRFKDDQLVRDLKEKDRQIAEANKQAAEANREAGKANKQAQDLEQKNIKLRTDLETATAEARSKQTELTREQQKMAKEQQKTAVAQKEAARTLVTAQFNLQQIRSLHMPRHLVRGDSRDKFMKALDSKPVAVIDIKWAADMFIGEPKQFAEEIAEALTEAKWTITKIEGVIIMNDPDPLNVKSPAGLRIFARDTDNPSAQALEWAFISSGLVAEIKRSERLEGDALSLMVFMIPADGGRVLRFSK